MYQSYWDYLKASKEDVMWVLTGLLATLSYYYFGSALSERSLRVKDRPSVTTVTEGLGFSHAGLLHKTKNRNKNKSKTTVARLQLWKD